ncbi:MAG TPA: hydroxyacid dehydrogenase [Chloroflexota bacterium]|nr:hydroxyacid dehydrogenase [Chloroflexota bacterium]
MSKLSSAARREGTRPRILVCCNSTVRREYVAGEGVERLQRLADWEWLASEGVSSRKDIWGGPSDDAADATRLRTRLAEGFDALIVCHGAPYVDASIMDAAPRTRLIGELEGDRFANRIDVEAAIARGVRVVDTTHGSSLPVAEWALGLMLIGLRNAGAQFRRLIGGEEFHRSTDDAGYRLGELTGRSVGLIGLGHIGRRLIELLGPFRCPIVAYDPYVSKEVALALHVQLAPLERVMAESEVVVCTAPLTPRTQRMLGAAELDLLKPDAVFVNVSRGAIVDPDALIARARRGDIRVSLDVFDPEPIPAGSPIRDLPNVFLSPHIAGVTAACRPRFFSFMVDELERFCAGHETLFDITPSTLANRRGVATPGASRG